MSCKIKKGINIWSFPQDMGIIDSMKLAKRAGFEGIELALAKKGSLSLESSKEEIINYKKIADKLDIKINSLATGLFWEYSITSNREDIRAKAVEIINKQLDAASLLEADTILVCPGSVGCDFKPSDVVPDAEEIDFFVGAEVINYETAWERAISVIKKVEPIAKNKKIIIGIENIWNKFLLSPLEMRNFIDEINSPWVQVLFDVGNVLLIGYPQHWIKILNKRIKKVHFKDFRRDVPTLAGFVDLLAGDVDWIKVMEAFNEIGYEGWANAEMVPQYKQHTEQIIYNTSASMDKILNRS